MGGGGGGSQAAAIVPRVPSPPPSPSSPTLTGLREPAAPVDKGAATPHPAQPPPPPTPRPSSPAYSPPSLGPHSPQFSPLPRRKGQHGHLWRCWTGCSIPGPALRQPPEGQLWWGGPGQGLRDRGSTSWCGGTYCRQGRRASRNWKARSRESQT